MVKIFECVCISMGKIEWHIWLRFIQWEKSNGIFQWHFWLRIIQWEKSNGIFQWHIWLRFIQCVCFQWEIFDGRFLMVDSFNVFVLSIGNFRWQILSMVDIQWKKL